MDLHSDVIIAVNYLLRNGLSGRFCTYDYKTHTLRANPGLKDVAPQDDRLRNSSIWTVKHESLDLMILVENALGDNPDSIAAAVDSLKDRGIRIPSALELRAKGALGKKKSVGSTRIVKPVDPYDLHSTVNDYLKEPSAFSRLSFSPWIQRTDPLVAKLLPAALNLEFRAVVSLYGFGFDVFSLLDKMQPRFPPEWAEGIQKRYSPLNSVNGEFTNAARGVNVQKYVSPRGHSQGRYGATSQEHASVITTELLHATSLVPKNIPQPSTLSSDAEQRAIKYAYSAGILGAYCLYLAAPNAAERFPYQFIARPLSAIISRIGESTRINNLVDETILNFQDAIVLYLDSKDHVVQRKEARSITGYLQETLRELDINPQLGRINSGERFFDQYFMLGGSEVRADEPVKTLGQLVSYNLRTVHPDRIISYIQRVHSLSCALLDIYSG